MGEAAEKNMQLGDHLRRLREAKDLSIRGLAAAANVDATALSRIERGLVASPDPRTLYRLARALDVEMARLYEDAGYDLPGFA